MELGHQCRIITSLAAVNQFFGYQEGLCTVQIFDNTWFVNAIDELFIHQLSGLLVYRKNSPVQPHKFHRKPGTVYKAVCPASVWFFQPGTPMIKVGVHSHRESRLNIHRIRVTLPANRMVPDGRGHGYGEQEIEPFGKGRIPLSEGQYWGFGGSSKEGYGCIPKEWPAVIQVWRLASDVSPPGVI